MSVNTTSPDKLFPYSDNSTAVNLVLITVFIVIITWIIAGNITVVIAVRVSSALKSSPSNILIANLAVSDLLLGTLVLPFSAMYDIFQYWPIGKELCFLWLIIDVLLCTASIWGLVVIAIDRYTATFRPIWYRSGHHMKRSVIYITTVWLISTVTSIPPLFGFGNMTRKSYLQAPHPPTCSLFIRIDFVMYSSIMTFVVPAIFLFLIYGRIYVELRRRSSEMERLKANLRKTMANTGARPQQIQQRLQDIEEDESSSPHETSDLANNISPSDTSEDASDGKRLTKEPNRMQYESSLIPLKDLDDSRNQQSSTECKYRPTKNEDTDINRLKEMSSKRKRDRREEKATRIMLTIMIIFVVCWMPFFIMYVTRSALDHRCPNCIPTFVQKLLIWLGYINSALNPILYTSFNRQFRKAFRAIWCCKHTNLH
ncbi:TyrR [Bugula neritina]|uniref:TyrR n=1 Tax=Bugula neritina TaxID=10212 RepID=A0A7J7J2Q4_BUGNE|nr:TyrR [Bugula neritina]